jgi:prophage DNA circulation protein
MPIPFEEWRASLRPASFRGVGFKVDVNARMGGRRININEFPMRDVGYVEDLGRRIRRFSVTGYVIGPDFLQQRDALIAALETEGPGTFVHPTMGEFTVNVGDFTAVERRERGRVVEFEMPFVEAGNQGGTSPTVDTQSAVTSAASSAEAASSSNVDTTLQGYASGTTAV